MRNLIIAMMTVACMVGAGTANAQYYYDYNAPRQYEYNTPRQYEYNSTPWSSWLPSQNNTRTVNCNVVHQMPNFSRSDRNGDGYLSGWELRRMGMSRSAISQVDLNNNGIVTRNEIRTARRSCN